LGALCRRLAVLRQRLFELPFDAEGIGGSVARISAEVCYATDGNEDELIREFSETYSYIRANGELSFRYRGEPTEEDLLAGGDDSVLPLPVNPFQQNGDRAAETRPTETERLRK
jgi:hypothetical protein